AGVTTASVGLLTLVPSGFLPSEDQGYFFVDAQLPNAASLGRTQGVMEEIGKTARATDGVADVISISGYSLLSGSTTNGGLAIVVLKPWDQRTRQATQIDAILTRVKSKLAA